MAIIENLDVFEERGFGLAPRGEPGSMLDLGFERAEEALHGSVALAIALSAHDDPAHEPDGVLGCVGGDERKFRLHGINAH